MRPLTFKSNFAKNPCKIPMALLVPLLLFGCSGGKTGKSDSGAKSKDVQVQTTGSEEQRKLAMGATAVPGVSVSAVFGADADKLMAFGLKELGKSGDSLSLAGPVYKLSATADRKPGPDGCYAVLLVTSGSICFDEKISAPVFLVPTVVPGTAAAPKLGLLGNLEKSSEMTKEFAGGNTLMIIACGKPTRHQSVVVEPQPEGVAGLDDAKKKPDYQNTKVEPPKTEGVGGPEVGSAGVNSSPNQLLAVPDKGRMTSDQLDQLKLEAEPLIPVQEFQPKTEESSSTAAAAQTAATTGNAPPAVVIEEIVPATERASDSSTSQTEPADSATTTTTTTTTSENRYLEEKNKHKDDGIKGGSEFGRDPNASPDPESPPPPTIQEENAIHRGGRNVNDDKLEDLDEAYQE